MGGNEPHLELHFFGAAPLGLADEFPRAEAGDGGEDRVDTVGPAQADGGKKAADLGPRNAPCPTIFSCLRAHRKLRPRTTMKSTK